MRVPTIDRWAGAVFARWPTLGPRLSDLETSALGGLEALPRVRAPVFVTGLARAGSTLLLEILHASGVFASHQYQDYPLLWTPYWWNHLLQRLPRGRVAPSERAHGDRILVTRESPEAFEEVLWQQAFGAAADAMGSDLLDADTAHPEFEARYRAHIGKLLAVKGRARYLAKANAHLPRLRYLSKLFPDARFIVPVREPLAHVASLVRQDQRFCEWSRQTPEIGRHLVRAGHREFGPGKRPLRVADADSVAAIERAFAEGDAVLGYALQWAQLHDWLLRALAHDDELDRACLLVDHDALCAAPEPMIAAIAARAGLDPTSASALAARESGRIRAGGELESDAANARRVNAITGEIWARVQTRAGAT